LANGTLFFEKNISEVILNADIVFPSIDTATEEVLKKINLPAKNLSFDKYING